MIERGRVSVNGRIVSRLPAFVDPGADRVEVDGRPIQAAAQRRLYIMLHKPARILTVSADEPGADRRTVLDLVDHPAKARLFPVGRLDYDSTGLVLLTNDGELANLLMHPRFGVTKTYHAVVRGQVGGDALRRLPKEIDTADRRFRRARAAGASGPTRGVRTLRPVRWAPPKSGLDLRVRSQDADRAVIEITLREARNHQARRVLAGFGLPVKKLTRVAIGPLRLTGLAVGAWRELERHELAALRRAARAGRAGAPPNPARSSPLRPRPHSAEVTP